MDVEPTEATIKQGRLPEAMSASIASINFSGRIRNSPSTGILRTLFCPKPNVIAAFSDEECVCSETYTVRPGAHSVRSAIRIHVLACSAQRLHHADRSRVIDDAEELIT